MNAKALEPIPIAAASPMPPTIDRPGYFFNIRAPSLKSMRESSIQRNERVSR